MTKTKHPNKGHSPNNGQRPMYQSVRYSETPLYMAHTDIISIDTTSMGLTLARPNY